MSEIKTEYRGRSKVWIAYRKGEPGILCVASEESQLTVKPKAPRRDPRYLFNGQLSVAAMIAVAGKLK